MKIEMLNHHYLGSVVVMNLWKDNKDYYYKTIAYGKRDDVRAFRKSIVEIFLFSFDNNINKCHIIRMIDNEIINYKAEHQNK